MFEGQVHDARFIPGSRGQLFVSLRTPPGLTSGRCVLFVPPFGEEMNKTRRMLALVSAEATSRGLASLLVDPFGTGDSAGEFRDATWSGWLEDVGAGVQWARSIGWQVDMLLGVRLGCALAAAACASLPIVMQRSVLWQPVFDGKRFLTQLLRMRALASEMGSARETVSGLRARLAAGDILEVGGYELASRLAQDIEALAPPVAARNLGSIHWIDVSSHPFEGAARNIKQKCGNFKDAASLDVLGLEGEPFWSTTELVDVPRLVSTSAEILAAAP